MQRFRPESEAGRRQPGQRIGAYRVVACLGPARLGTRYQVRAGERLLALYRLDGLPLDRDGRLLARIQEVMAPVRDLRHPAILPLLDLGEDQGVPFLVTEDCGAATLADLLGPPRAWREVLPIAQGVAEALDYAHARGMVHGGLEPAVVQYQTDGRVLVGGFGLAQLLWLVPLAQRAVLLAGQLTLAPEQHAGDPATTRSDVWAYGALLYELLTGQPPVPRAAGAPPEPPSTLVGGLGGAVDAVLLAALAADPARRPAAAGQVLRELIALAPGGSRSQRTLLLHYRRPELPPGDPLRAASQSAVLERPLGGERASVPPVLRPLEPLPPRPTLRERITQGVLALLDWARVRPLEATLAGVAVLLLGVGLARFTGVSQPPAVSGTALSTLTTASPPGAWTMLGHDPARTSFAPEAGSLLDGRVVWHVLLGSPVTAPPVSAGSLVLVGLADGRVVARELSSGAAKWEYRASGAIEAGPAVADGLAFVGLKDGRLVALDAASGGLRWEFRTGGPITAAPLAVDGVLYVASQDGSLYALDAAAGTLRWRYTAGTPLGAPPAVANGLVVVGASDGGLHLLDQFTGVGRWIYRAGGAIEAAPLLAGGFAYAANERGIVHAVDPFARGAPFEWQWRELQARFYLWGLPVGLPGPQPGYKWSANVGAPVKGALAAAGTLLYVPGSDGKLSALDALTGSLRWQAQFGGPVAPPIVAGDLVYAGAEDKRLTVLNAGEGSRLLELTLSGTVRLPPALARGLLLVAVDEGKLYAVR
ncbi:MAG: hypothetical protein KatS3mg061_1576 [Dehalococcoidia bacterium]|nr:MAG: hypothetical protein KatS3mg061_1576 [Dehalococcoidia bacterium]